MKAVYLGNDITIEVWKDQHHKRDMKLSKGMKFNMGVWSGMKCDEISVLTDDGEFVCDIESQGFKNHFTIV